MFVRREEERRGESIYWCVEGKCEGIRKAKVGEEKWEEGGVSARVPDSQIFLWAVRGNTCAACLHGEINEPGATKRSDKGPDRSQATLTPGQTRADYWSLNSATSAFISFAHPHFGLSSFTVALRDGTSTSTLGSGW